MYSRVLKNLFKFSSGYNQTQKYTFAKDIPASVHRNHMNLFTAINSAIDVSLATDPT